jgi:hypothetical protein
MIATSETPPLELIDRLIDADLEVERLLERLRGLDRRLARARGHVAGPDAHTPLRQAYLCWVEGEYGAALGQLRAARRRAQALCLLD